MRNPSNISQHSQLNHPATKSQPEIRLADLANLAKIATASGVANFRSIRFTPKMATEQDRQFMTAAIAEARRAEAEGEVPVGAIAVVGEQIIGSGHNRPISLGDPTAHAEVLAIRSAASQLKAYRLAEVSIYVTLEPCVMCVGAMVNARISRVIYGARDEKAGALGSMYDIGRDGRLNHRFEVVGGVMESECAEIMREFFRARRANE